MSDDTFNQETGCVLVPNDERDYDIALLMPQGGEDLPPLPKKHIMPPKKILNQERIDSCVGHGGTLAHSTNEGVLLSPRYTWAMCKKLDHYRGWGTTVYNMMKVMRTGCLPYNQHIVDNSGLERDLYMRPNLPNNHRELADPFRVHSFWRVKDWDRGKDTTSLQEAMYRFNVPLITTLPWYKNFKPDRKGFLPLPDTKRSFSGHLVVCNGYHTDRKGVYFSFVNSWGNAWGKKGHFYIYAKDLHKFRFRGFHAPLDVPQNKAKVLNKYQGRIVRNHPTDDDHFPEHYYVGKGKIAHIGSGQKFVFGRDNGFWGDWWTTLTIAEPLRGTEDFKF